eukprot:403355488
MHQHIHNFSITPTNKTTLKAVGMAMISDMGVRQTVQSLQGQFKAEIIAASPEKNPEKFNSSILNLQQIQGQDDDRVADSFRSSPIDSYNQTQDEFSYADIKQGNDNIYGSINLMQQKSNQANQKQNNNHNEQLHQQQQMQSDINFQQINNPTIGRNNNLISNNQPHFNSAKFNDNSQISINKHQNSAIFASMFQKETQNNVFPEKHHSSYMKSNQNLPQLPILQKNHSQNNRAETTNNQYLISQQSPRSGGGHTRNQQSQQYSPSYQNPLNLAKLNNQQYPQNFQENYRNEFGISQNRSNLMSSQVGKPSNENLGLNQENLLHNSNNRRLLLSAHAQSILQGSSQFNNFNQDLSAPSSGQTVQQIFNFGQNDQIQQNYASIRLSSRVGLKQEQQEYQHWLRQENLRQQDDYYFMQKYYSRSKPSEYNHYSASFNGGI